MINNLSGLLLIDKPTGITTFDCIRHIKKILKAKIKIGHMGTLDPFASGLVIVALGKATKNSKNLLTLDKEYIATGKIGVLTNTLDLTGNIVHTDPSLIRVDIQNTIENFCSKYIQTPPIFSALKHQGKRLHELARKNLDNEKLQQIASYKKREIEIHKIDLLKYESPFFEIRAHVSHGTYIRSLINDIGIKAGSFATTFKLKRTKIGLFSLFDAVPLAHLNTLADIAINLKIQ